MQNIWFLFLVFLCPLFTVLSHTNITFPIAYIDFKFFYREISALFLEIVEIRKPNIYSVPTEQASKESAYENYEKLFFFS